MPAQNMNSTIAIPQLIARPSLSPVERTKRLLESSGWYRIARMLLWGVVLTAGVKPAEIMGIGEQLKYGNAIQNVPEDLIFRCAVLGACMFATFIALIANRIRLVTLMFVPFMLWTGLVALVQQSDAFAAKQLASYLTWILFFIAATALLDRPEDSKNLRNCMLGAVIVSALGGVLQFALGNAPMVGFIWHNSGFPRVHTGAGGLLMDAFTPYCASFVFLTASETRPKLQIGGVLLALWASGNILRGGLFGFALAMAWLLSIAPRDFRFKLLKGTGAVFLLVALCFGGSIATKSMAADDDSPTGRSFNTSGRFEHWPLLIEWIREEPVWGHGPNADMYLLANGEGSDLRVSHNELLSTAVNFGVVGAILLWFPLLALLACILRLSYKHRRSKPETLLAASAALIMVTVLSLTDNTMRIAEFMLVGLAPVAIALNRYELLDGA